MALARAADKNVVEAIVVIVADGYSHAEQWIASPLCDVGKGAVMIVVIELRCSAFPGWPGQLVPLISSMSGQPSLS